MKNLEILTPEKLTQLNIPLFDTAVSAGFPSPADDFSDKKLDLNEHLIKHPAATFFVRVKGQSMQDAKIDTDDILVVDRSLDPRDDAIVIASIDGELTVKRVGKINGELHLLPQNPSYRPIKINPEDDLTIFGVVVWVIKNVV